MSDATRPAPPSPALLSEALEALPDGVAVFDADWTIVYVNQAGADLLRRAPADLLGRNIWVALPEIGGTILHSFLLHARSVGQRVAWNGFYAPAGRWLTAHAVLVGERLHVDFHEATARAEGVAPDDPAVQPEPDFDGVPDRLRFLAEVSESMISTLDTGEAVEKLADLVVPGLCDWAVVQTLREDGQPGAERGVAHRDPERLADVLTWISQPPRQESNNSELAQAFLGGQLVHMSAEDPILTEVLRDLPDDVREVWDRLDVGSFTIVPLRARSQTLGALSMVNSAKRRPHSEMEIALAVEVARRAGLALDNTRLYGQQLEMAETLQRSMLTPPPQPDDLEIAVRYQPAASNMHVGGDWYDAFLQPDGATLLIIGDVVGHNVDAAAAMGQFRSILRGIAYDRQESPARILARVDDVVCGLRIGSMATALIAQIEQTPEQAEQGLRTLRWSSAGHLPPIVRHADGRVELLATPAETLLGTETGHSHTDQDVVVLPGDTLFFYTDGLVEQGRTLIDEGLDRLTAVLAELGHLPLDDLCDQLLQRIVPQRGDDDIAIVAVRCHPQSETG